MPGRHNALNATAAIGVAHELGASVDVIRKAISGFGGVKRRFTRTGEWNGVSIYDDYGHHPVEISAVLKAARAASAGKVIAVVQPHRYTRLASLFDAFATCFNDADSVIVADVYPAGEAPIDGADKSALAAAIAAHGHRHALALPSPDKLAPLDPLVGCSRATTSSSSAPGRSRNGPTRCPANSRLSTRRRRIVVHLNQSDERIPDCGGAGLALGPPRKPDQGARGWIPVLTHSL